MANSLCWSILSCPHHARRPASALSGRLYLLLGFPPFFLWVRCATVVRVRQAGWILRYLFEDCALDTDRRELRRGAALVAVEPQVFDLLVYLIRTGPRGQQGRSAGLVWHGRMVSESALVTHQRRPGAIGDTGEAAAPDQDPASQGHPICRRSTGGSTPRGSSASDSAAAIRAVAAGPSVARGPAVHDMSGDPDQAHFADGISEDLITGLARIRWLFVIARNSSFVYKHRAVDVKEVSRELGVRYVLEGSVRRAGSRLRISAQLVDAMTGGHHWAERYDRELGDIFAVRTRSPAASPQPSSPTDGCGGHSGLSRSSDDLSAWELVARAQTHFWRMSRRTMRRRSASSSGRSRLPDYAPAESLLGFRLVFGAHMGWVDRDQGCFPAASTRLGPSRSTTGTPGGTSRSAIGP